MPVASRKELLFWTAQLTIWSSYGLLLMLPWIGTYTVGSMLPTKIAIAGTALITSTGLRFFYDAAAHRNLGGERTLFLVLTASVIAGVLWSLSAATIITGGATHSIPAIGLLEGGIPLLGGPLYHILVMLTWSLGYLALQSFGHSRFPHHQPEASSPALDTSVGKFVARDGARSIVFEANEITWARAEGDYVRLHTERKNILIRCTMLQLQAKLSSGLYTRIHRSTIVNTEFVREVIAHPHSEFVVVLRNGTKLKVSRSYSSALRAKLGIQAKEHRPR